MISMVISLMLLCLFTDAVHRSNHSLHTEAPKSNRKWTGKGCEERDW